MSFPGSGLNRSNFFTLFSAGAALLLALGMAFYPAQVFFASTRGLKLWWEIVLPSILPFLIIAEIMMGLGIVHFFGALLEPLMRPLFNLPGAASFVVVMGYTSGFPVGAVLTSRLRRSELCTRLEGERLLSFTNNASPLFLLAALPVGMLGLPAVGFYLAAVNYTVNLLIGILFRFYGGNQPSPLPWKAGSPYRLKNPVTALLEGRRTDGRPLGKIMGDAVKNATTNLLIIGGFIVFFSVLLQLIGVLGIWDGLIGMTSALLGGLLTPGLVEGLNAGFWEITLGCQTASQAAAPLEIKIALLGFLLGWSGLSIHAQVASMIADTDLRFAPFVASRILHGMLAAAALYIGFRLNLFSLAHPALASLKADYSSSWMMSFWWSCKALGGSLVFLTLLALGRGVLGCLKPPRHEKFRRPLSY